MSVVSLKLNDVAFDTVRDVNGLIINSQYNLSAKANLSLDKVIFCNTELSNTSDLLRNYHDTLPTEGAKLTVVISNDTDVLEYNFICDYNDYTKLSDNETEVAVYQEDSVDPLLAAQGADITMLLMEELGYLTSSHYINHPYVVHNRKTTLEKLQLAAQIFTTIKAANDEVFKIVNIAADITTAGIAQATVNLIQTVAGLGVLIPKLINDIKSLYESLFPPMRYHSAIELKTFITQAADYLGYTVEFGTWDFNPVLIPSKNDEIGEKEPNTTDTQSGILNSDDFGYTLKESFELSIQLMNGEIAVIDKVLHVRPKSDPFWLTLSGYIMPDVLVETSAISDLDSSIVYNRGEVFAGRITSYITDDSDYWTIQKTATDTNGDRIATRIVTPLTTVSNKRVNLNGIITNKIPYALAVRKDTVDDLLIIFKESVSAFNGLSDKIQATFDSVSEFFEEALLPFEGLPSFDFNRDGALKVENHFFNKPKLSILVDNELGEKRIPSNFNDIIGAKAIEQNWYNYDSFVDGVRNPIDPSDTNGKEVFRGVRIGFTLPDIQTVLNRGYFTTQSGKRGRFTSNAWDISGDFAICDYWVQDNWLKNIKEEIK